MLPAGLLARTFHLPISPVGIASSCHRRLHRLRFCFPPSATYVASSTHPLRAAAGPYPFVKLSKPWPSASSITSALEPRFFSSNGTTPLPAAGRPVLPRRRSGTGSCSRLLHSLLRSSSSGASRGSPSGDPSLASSRRSHGRSLPHRIIRYVYPPPRVF